MRWINLSPEEKALAVDILASTYETGYATGSLDEYDWVRLSIGDKKAALINAHVKQPYFPKTVATYVSEIDNFYREYPTSETTLDGLAFCLADRPGPRCPGF